MSRRAVLLAVIVGALASAAAWFAARSGERPAVVPDTVPPVAAQPSPVGRRIDDFTLPDYHGRPHPLSEWADSPVVVVVFLGTDCMLSRRYGPRLAEMAATFGPRGVAFVGVDANEQDSLTDLAAFARKQMIPFPILKDGDGAVAARMGALRTPEAFVLDGRRVVRYWGRIDDQFGVGVQRGGPERRCLAAALDELLNGRPVSRPCIPAVGCRIGRRPAAPRDSDAPAVTYTNEISRILQHCCVECHRAGEAAPFSLTDYRDAAAWAPMMREVVQEGRMPPWFADPRHGSFRNDARLTVDEKQALLRWIDDGCPEGDAADLPPGRTSADGWRIPAPDRVLFMADQPYDVPAEGEVAYQYFSVDPGFKEDTYLQAVEVRPGNAAVVHHALVLIEPPGSDGLPRVDSLGALIDYAPGMAPTVLPEGMAIRVPAGSRFLFQMHYTPDGAAENDRTRLGLVFADPAKVTKRVEGGAVVNQAIALPAGAPDYSLTAEYAVPRDVLLLSMSPHLHLRGKSFRFEAVYPDGRTEILLDVPRYDFNWQLRYELAEPKPLPKGTRLLCTAHWDNSANNPANPDSTRAVGWGDQTGEEMLIGFFAFTSAE
jgi:peroxiredoxin